MLALSIDFSATELLLSIPLKRSLESKAGYKLEHLLLSLL